LLAFAADSGAFSALGSEDVGVSGVGVAPAQVVLDAAGQRGVVRVVRGAHGEGPQRPELGLDGVCPGGAGRGEAQLDVVAGGPGADLGGLVRREVVQDDVDRGTVGAGGPDRFQGGEGVLAALASSGDAPELVVTEDESSRGSTGCRACACRSRAAASGATRAPR
jgi:hypothetical protein